MILKVKLYYNIGDNNNYDEIYFLKHEEAQRFIAKHTNEYDRYEYEYIWLN